MKVLLTGHTSGIGKFLHEYLQRFGHEVTGVSRATGYDITEPYSRELIITHSLSHDVFINNAYGDGRSQVTLLDWMHRTWVARQNRGLLINIGSRAIDRPVATSSYGDYKRDLFATSDHLARKRVPGIRICCVNFGYVATEPFKDRDEVLSLEYVGEVLCNIIDTPPGVQIRNMTIEAVSEPLDI
jgi:NAD(P)-dependent dehydrogenase (short-subunit alcohol dehydrogenase family)